MAGAGDSGRKELQPAGQRAAEGRDEPAGDAGEQRRRGDAGERFLHYRPYARRSDADDREHAEPGDKNGLPCAGRPARDTDRAQRIRQYEDFFNVSGMGTADDLEEFRACQEGYAGTAAPWNDLSRGAPLWREGADENAVKMGLNPLLSGERSEDEGLFVCQHDFWVSAMRKAVEAEKQGAQA